MLTPQPKHSSTGAITQNAVTPAGLPSRSSILNSGQSPKKRGYAVPHALNTPFVPIRRWSAGKMSKIQTACDRPVRPNSNDICRGENPKPPSETLVNQNTGTIAVYENASSARYPNANKTTGT